MAWLNAAPKKNDKDEDPLTRYQVLKEDDPQRDLPPIDEYIANCFNLAGVCLSGGMSLTPLTWVELDAFCKCSAYSLTGWESEQIILMSRDYIGMRDKAKEVNCPCPLIDGIQDENDKSEAIRDKVIRQFDAFFK